MNLDLALKAVAILILVAVGYEFAAHDRISLPAVVVANIFFVMSIFARKHARRISIIALGLAFVVPIGTIRSYLAGETDELSVIIHVFACGYLAYVAFSTFRTEAAALLERAKRPRTPTAEGAAQDDAPDNDQTK